MDLKIDSALEASSQKLDSKVNFSFSSTAQNPTNICYNDTGAFDVQLIATNINGSDTLLKINYISVLLTPIANAGNNDTICFGESTTLGGAPTASSGTPPYSYDWIPSALLSNPNTSNPFATPTVTTIYYVTVTDSNGCIDIDSVTIEVITCPGIQEYNPINQFSIYPNPFKDNTLIKYTLLNNAKITLVIYNILGKKVYTIVNEQQAAGNYQYALDAKEQGLAGGVYLLKLKVDDRDFVIKLLSY